VAPSGALLEAFGAPELVNDTLLLRGLAMPDAAVLYFQGTTSVNGGSGSAFGDGLRCVTGSVRRLGTLDNAQGWSAYPAPGQARVSVAGQIAAPGTLHYQAWYRNAAAFCTADTFNLTNGVSVIWTL
jgi:hypothetical protein